MSASFQNVFFGELLDALSTTLTEAGVRVRRAVDHFPSLGARAAFVYVPHEFLPLVKEDAHPTAAELARTVSICTEQPGTPWFEISAEACARSGATVDINPLGVAELRRRGVRARHLQLGYVPAWDLWGGSPLPERSTDVTFMGGHTPRRAQVLAACAPALVRRRAALHVSQALTTHQSGSRQFVAGEQKWRHLADSRVLLNVHRDELGYLEWQRVIEAIANGCVVVSEHSQGVAPLEPGHHLVLASLASLPLMLDAILSDGARLQEMRASAYTFLREQLPLSRSVGVLLDAIDDVARQEVSGARVGNGRPRPARPAEPPTALEIAMSAGGEARELRRALAAVQRDQRVLRASLGDSRHDLRGSQVTRVDAYGARRTAPPEVSVVLTAHLHEEIGRAIVSIATSDHEDLELVVVDDGASERSAAAIAEAVSGCQWLSATVVSSSGELGLAASRNVGVARATGEHVLVVDADMVLYPHCLSRLLDALRSDPSAHFAYALTAEHDEFGPRDLQGCLTWEPERLRYGDFVGPTVLIRRTSVLEAGGYPEDPRLAGWDAFALWCAFARQGRRGIRVPEILARCKRDSRLGGYPSVNEDGEVWRLLAARYADVLLSSSAPLSDDAWQVAAAP